MPQPQHVDYKIVLKSGRFDTEAGAGLPQLQSIFERVRQEAPRHLVIHLHGGLISRAEGEAAAARLAPYYREAGALPMFVIWESGWAEVIGQRLSAIANEGIFQTILSRATRFVRGKLDKELGPDGGRGAADQLPLSVQAKANAELAIGKAGQEMFADLPLDAFPREADSLNAAERQQIEDELASDLQFDRRVLALETGVPADPTSGSKGIAAEDQVSTLMDPEVLAALKPPAGQAGTSKSLLSTAVAAKHVLEVVGRVVWRFAHRRHHGPYLTIVEEVLRAFYIGPVGKFLWDGMESAINDAFATPDAGGAALADALKQMWESGVHPKVTLVGHSAGAIYAARLLKELDVRLPPDCKINLVLIAPACTFAVLGDALRSAGERVTGLRIFGMSDPIELKDVIVPLVYPASLLYFVSGVLEQDSDEPLVGMQRYYTSPYDGEEFPVIKSIRALDYLTREHAFAWSDVSGFEGANSDMKSHGGWVDAEQTRLSVMAIIQSGYGYK